MIKIITPLTIILLTTTSYSKEVNLNIGGFTHHTKERKGSKDWNEVHNNIGTEYAQDNWFVNVEYFKDSFDNHNGLLAGGYKYRPSEYICLPLGLGVFANYKDNIVTPYSGIEINTGTSLTIRTAYMPPLAVEQGNKTGYIFTGFKLKIKEW